jgi:hypothetical protein
MFLSIFLIGHMILAFFSMGCLRILVRLLLGILYRRECIILASIMACMPFIECQKGEKCRYERTKDSGPLSLIVRGGWRLLSIQMTGLTYSQSTFWVPSKSQAVAMKKWYAHSDKYQKSVWGMSQDILLLAPWFLVSLKKWIQSRKTASLPSHTLQSRKYLDTRRVKTSEHNNSTEWTRTQVIRNHSIGKIKGGTRYAGRFCGAHIQSLLPPALWDEKIQSAGSTIYHVLLIQPNRPSRSLTSDMPGDNRCSFNFSSWKAMRRAVLHISNYMGGPKVHSLTFISANIGYISK